ncbi:hypothetical protein F4677DRAFT_381302 [Hypoxylon crocopeplum]|nr:hypothetical protein F4677DRAFT_381302 [Hypoxylon crocopeplum]
MRVTRTQAPVIDYRGHPLDDCLDDHLGSDAEKEFGKKGKKTLDDADSDYEPPRGEKTSEKQVSRRRSGNNKASRILAKDNSKPRADATEAVLNSQKRDRAVSQSEPTAPVRKKTRQSYEMACQPSQESNGPTSQADYGMNVTAGASGASGVHGANAPGNSNDLGSSNGPSGPGPVQTSMGAMPPSTVYTYSSIFDIRQELSMAEQFAFAKWMINNGINSGKPFMVNLNSIYQAQGEVFVLVAQLRTLYSLFNWWTPYDLPFNIGGIEVVDLFTELNNVKAIMGSPTYHPNH